MGATVASSRGSVDIGSVDLIKCIKLLLGFSPALLSEECFLYFMLMTTSVTHSPLVLARMCGKWCYYGTFVLVPVVQVGSNLVVFGKRSLKDFRKRYFLEYLSYVSFERMKRS